MGRTQVLRTIYDALGRSDVETMRAHVRDDVEIVERLEVPGASVYRGIEEWRRGYEREAETMQAFAADFQAVEEFGTRAVVDVVISVRGRSSGAEVAERLAHLVDFDEDGRAARFRAFSDVEEARQLAREEEVRDLYAIWLSGDLEAALRRVHPQIDWAEPEETIGAQRGTGRDRAREGVEQWAGSFDSYEGEVTAVESLGDNVLVEFTQRIHAGGSAVPLETPVYHLWAFRDGLPARMEMYFERDQAVAAVRP